MKPIDKQFGFWLLAIGGLFCSIIGNPYLAVALLVSSLFYEAIKQ